MATTSSSDVPDVVIKSIFAKYDKDGSKSINPFELGSLLFDLGFHVPKDKLPDLVSQIDADGTGRVELSDFTKWWHQSAKFAHLDGQSLDRLSQASSYFRFFDKDRCGSISREEFKIMFADLVKNSLVPKTAVCDDVLKQLDGDHSGTISFNEFMSWMDKVQRK